MTKTYITHSEAETGRAGFELAPLLPAASVLLLFGDLGAGKTLFAKGLAAGFGVALAPRSISVLSRPEIVYRDLVPPAPAADVSMVHHRDPGPVLTRFLSIARRFLAEWRAQQ